MWHFATEVPKNILVVIHITHILKIQDFLRTHYTQLGTK
jgi:hypothetical protein